MSDDLTRLVAEVAQQERELRFATFSNDDAWELGTLLVELAMERDLAVTVDIRRGRQQLFHAARPGTSPDNDSWIERKARVVERFGTSSYLQGLRHRAAGTTFADKQQLSVQRYAAHGGAFPVHVEGVGIVGVVTVSGLAQADDHALVVEAVRRFLDG
ncbi:heme-degrading domain-containing protein [Cellulomonas denverensis]|uniref:UPF0303 protein HGA03_00085 n=1 Tax=Cellulomonas denverensis TaxID=264297 RepID=A0A7X6KRS5_9CELL|nr:heme-degrading domain-containing protein [Cellulomonas denverensis]NKY21061.1 heme-degrading domain-containing protein [Cellulomonas denverensis]GIG26008.1 UPF0303 protein [Cellulomonas denverensis]